MKSAGTTWPPKGTSGRIDAVRLLLDRLECETRRAAPPDALGQLLDGAINVPVIEGARDTILRRRRAVAVRFFVDSEQPPILRQRREAPSPVIFWVDVEDPPRRRLRAARVFGGRGRSF